MPNKTHEHQEITDEILKEYIIATSSLHRYFKFEWGCLKARHYCGILHLNHANYYILPKIAYSETQNLNTFIYMLIYAYDMKLSNEDIAHCVNVKSHSIVEVFVDIFAKGLLNELKRGVYKEYQTHQDNLTTLRGKYLLNENYKHNFTHHKIYCEYDEFSPDNPLNQFLLYAIKYLQRFVQNKKLLKQCEVILDEVEAKVIDIHRLTIDFNRLNHRFKRSYELALLLLHQSIPLFTTHQKSFAFLFDMNVLFEKFIARIVKELDSDTQIQNQRVLNDLILKPDIITSKLIIDTKYKKRESIKQSDKYQAFAYGIHYQKDVMLLYPKHLEDRDRDLILGNREQAVKLKIASIDLDFDGCYEEYIREMKRRMEVLYGYNFN
ncbi:MAG: restriction endonuclease [Sulfurovum sp. FS08-3]|nr:MAG: restriction endonuclease [Sulfurovum sp. FS08-3]